MRHVTHKEKQAPFWDRIVGNSAFGCLGFLVLSLPKHRDHAKFSWWALPEAWHRIPSGGTSTRTAGTEMAQSTRAWWKKGFSFLLVLLLLPPPSLRL